MSPLHQFHPLIAQWFTERVGQPTAIQEKAWPRIAAGEHLLVTAPTGSGKTLTAFLWAINRLVTGEETPGHTSVLYVSPLKALNNDIYRNLISPLEELEQVFENAGEAFPEIHVQTRSGDTPSSERLRMQRQPPEILITTPESLNLLLSSQGGRSMLTSLSVVILDEIHSVVSTKRGVHLITAIDRLVPLSGEFQRIALSATVRPLETVAEFVGGFTLEGTVQNPRYVPRQVSILHSAETKEYRIRVCFPGQINPASSKESVWEPLAEDFRRLIGRNRSTLLFTNSRRLCEKLTLKINSGEEEPVAYAHHGSLSRELRSEVERKLKAGKLRAIVATNSLEMGIDIGALDEVVLVQSPPSVSSAIQRIGRAGHQVGQISRGSLFPTHTQDFLEAAVLASALLRQDIEASQLVHNPLDVLAQIIVSMVGLQKWDIDELYAHLKTSYPYRNLIREQFDLVLNMLAGRYADSRIRELRPRISIDWLDNTAEARKGALLALYMSGGTIPDRGYFHLRHQETNALIGELDEEFVWEASVGQTLTLGTQNWRIERITHNDVFVLPTSPKVIAPPFWRAEENGRDFHFSELIGNFLESANEKLEDPCFAELLQQEHHMDSGASRELIGFLKRQKESTKRDLPHRHHLLVEFTKAGPGGAPGNQVVLHTFWGRRINRPFAMALDAAWEERFGQRLEVFAANDCIMLLLPHDVCGEEILSLVRNVRVEELLRKRLECSGFFGARFRESAARALLLTRNKMNERMPLWMIRLRSQKLLDSVMKYADFPILLEAWRTCLQDEFDLEGLRQVLAELESGSITWSETYTSAPSPMAMNVSWNQISQYMYRDDEPPSGKTSKLRGDILHDVVFVPGLRPTIAREIIERFEQKRQRLSPGYSPETSRELLDWVMERVLLPTSEWAHLLQAIREDYGVKIEDLLEPLSEKLARIIPPLAAEPLIVAAELLPRLLYGLYGSADDVLVESLSGGGILPSREKEPNFPEGEADVLLSSILGEVLQFYGPRTTDSLCTMLGIEKQRLLLAMEDLADVQAVITGTLITDSADEEICDAENFEILLRKSRSEAIPTFEPLDIEELPLFIASYQGIVNPANDIEGLFQRLEQLLCYPVSAELWETEILPARGSSYSTSWLDTIMQEGDLRWIGGENHRVTFCFESELDLMQRATGKEPCQGAGEVSDIFPGPTGRYDFPTLLEAWDYQANKLSNRLWEAVWRGQITNDTFLALRRGIENQFKVPQIATTDESRHRNRRHRIPGRTGLSRWRGSLPMAGNWFRLPPPEATEDILDIEERKKDRVRLLLDRYGILFRELLERESPEFRWSNLFRSLRLMELSGEVLAGCFFHGIPGLQFISHQAFRKLQRGLPEDAIYWMNATDPASLCGIQSDALKGSLPKRTASSHLVYHGKRLVVVSRGRGKDLTFNIPSDDPYLQEYLSFLRHMLTRQFQPMRGITLETINGQEASHSPYLGALRTNFDVIVDFKKVVVYQKR